VSRADPAGPTGAAHTVRRKPTDESGDVFHDWRDRLRLPVPASPRCSARYKKAVDYWDKQEPTYDGVLGGFGHTSELDVRDSRELLEKVWCVAMSSSWSSCVRRACVLVRARACSCADEDLVNWRPPPLSRMPRKPRDLVGHDAAQKRYESSDLGQACRQRSREKQAEWRRARAAERKAAKAAARAEREAAEAAARAEREAAEAAAMAEGAAVARAQAMKEQLEAAERGERELTVLDCGAGVGRVTSELLRHHFHGRLRLDARARLIRVLPAHRPGSHGRGWCSDRLEGGLYVLSLLVVLLWRSGGPLGAQQAPTGHRRQALRAAVRSAAGCRSAKRRLALARLVTSGHTLRVPCPHAAEKNMSVLTIPKPRGKPGRFFCAGLQEHAFEEGRQAGPCLGLESTPPCLRRTTLARADTREPCVSQPQIRLHLGAGGCPKACLTMQKPDHPSRTIGRRPTLRGRAGRQATHRCGTPTRCTMHPCCVPLAPPPAVVHALPHRRGLHHALQAVSAICLHIAAHAAQHMDGRGHGRRSTAYA
jgi:hypothetical protein